MSMASASGTISIVGAPPSAASVHMDMLRGIAAIAVFLSHARDLVFVDYPQLVHPQPLLKLAYFVTGLGHQSVVVFFVLSGYLVGGSALKQIKHSKWSWKTYSFNRLTRLYTVLIPALILGWLLDRVGFDCFGSRGVYGGIGGRNDMPIFGPKSLSPVAFAGNLMFLQTIVVQPLGSNGPLWSLANEFWYYLAFPLLAMAVLGATKWYRRLGALLGMAIVLLFVGKAISLGFLIWLMGAALCLMPKRPFGTKLQGRFGMSAAVLVFFAMLVLTKLKSSYDLSWLLGVGTTLLLYAILRYSDGQWPFIYIRAATVLSRSSYTLYLVHMPLLVFLTAWLRATRWQPSGMHVIVGSLIVGFVYSCSQCLYWVFEFRTDYFRAKLRPLVFGGNNAKLWGRTIWAWVK
jgi:peptidoglycan/LPS O-acetylase OafA/YrhL